ncbi:MAG: 3-deoxy-7-phosphoheptulonate synthase [Lachnospiraceae bacterium]|nr:3-deoxy-7-phosphoheptulonate synthase [Lachnospiraceae bacterium]
MNILTNMDFHRRLPSPEELRRAIPLSPAGQEAKRLRDRQITDILAGRDSRMLLIIGPCSADREDAVVDYITRLKPVQEQVRDKLLIIPRIYTNKPRTTGDGYKGIASQPNPAEKPDMEKGLVSLRHMHVEVVNQTGFTCADEMLYPGNDAYLADFLSYIAVGARSVEDQQHRLVASGLAVPVGMKNPTSGDLTVMLNSITAAQHPHIFSYCGYEVETKGNPYAHAILRGYVDNQGRTRPNYHFEDLIGLYDMYRAKDLRNMAVIVDANHANSGKQYLQQIRIVNDVLHTCRHSGSIRSMVKGFMVESYIEDGSQQIGENIYGKSITDPCLGWEKTERLVYEMAEQL